MKPIKIITDTCSDITPETAEKYHIHLVPIHINFGEDSFKDQYELSNADFYDKLASFDGTPKTAQITVQEHMDVFSEYINEYEIIYIPLSANASGTFQSANLAKQTLLEDKPDAVIHIFENNTFTYGYGLWVIEAAKMANDGSSVQAILDMLQHKIYNTDVIFNVPSLDYLQKGGRISPTAKILANILDLSPILAIEGGLVVSREKVRGSKKVFPKMIDMLKTNGNEDYEQTICVMNGNCEERATAFRDMILDRTDYNNVMIVPIGPTVGIHAGPGVIGLAYQKK